MVGARPPGDGPVLRVGAVWQIGDGLVLVRRGAGASAAQWDLPGGAVRAGESLVEAIVRTTAADTGAAALCGPFLGWIEGIDETHVVTICFDTVVLEPPAIDAAGTMRPGPAAIDARLTPMWEVSEIMLGTGVAEFLSDQGMIDLVI